MPGEIRRILIWGGYIIRVRPIVMLMLYHVYLIIVVMITVICMYPIANVVCATVMSGRSHQDIRNHQNWKMPIFFKLRWIIISPLWWLCVTLSIANWYSYKISCWLVMSYCRGYLRIKMKQGVFISWWFWVHWRQRYCMIFTKVFWVGIWV